MVTSREKLLADLRELHKERRRLIRRLIRDRELAVGSVSDIRRKCGNPNCHCATGPGHLQTLFLFKDDEGVRRCKLVRRQDEARMIRAGKNYREFREDLKQLRAMDKREKQILMALRDEIGIQYK